MYPKGGQGLVVWQGLGETEIDCVSGDAHMNMEKVGCGLSKTSREKREMNGVWARGLHLTIALDLQLLGAGLCQSLGFSFSKKK